MSIVLSQTSEQCLAQNRHQIFCSIIRENINDLIRREKFVRRRDDTNRRTILGLIGGNTYSSTKLLLELINDCVCHLLFLCRRMRVLDLVVVLGNRRAFPGILAIFINSCTITTQMSDVISLSPASAHTQKTLLVSCLSTEKKQKPHQ